jgi:hypothetical protein
MSSTAWKTVKSGRRKEATRRGGKQLETGRKANVNTSHENMITRCTQIPKKKKIPNDVMEFFI